MLKDTRLNLERSIYFDLHWVAVYTKCEAVLPPSLSPSFLHSAHFPRDTAIRFYVFYFLHIFYTSFKLVLFWKVVNGLGFFPTLNNNRSSQSWVRGGGCGRRSVALFLEKKKDKGENDVSFLIVIYTPFFLSCLRFETDLRNSKCPWEKASCCISLVYKTFCWDLVSCGKESC